LLCNQSVGEGAPLDELLSEMAKARADGRWTPAVRSEQRRRALLPRTPAPAWAELIASESYRRACALLQV